MRGLAPVAPLDQVTAPYSSVARLHPAGLPADLPTATGARTTERQFSAPFRASPFGAHNEFIDPPGSISMSMSSRSQVSGSLGWASPTEPGDPPNSYLID